MISVALILLVGSVCLLITSHNTLEPALCIHLQFPHFLSVCQVVLTVAGEQVRVVRSVVNKMLHFPSLLITCSCEYSIQHVVSKDL
jgi:hypothetical protein